ncbi:hypothetical protein F5B22DRAFT_648195 [Xylaria bambusicola]|uniref:uncharacterized protein n=1 Tax=Xylaria bambusicola TaxID=326684 RepID=UPI0020074179|nr:uncharacterized protein F5B22DRAFT_648195 [Xylaria bambusicola]KAI0512847.1 hypothetical protein F5B22DRAFT_648195 [Xylaria bambusicola]
MYATRALRMAPTKRLMRVPHEDQGAHTISQRLRKLRQIPAELIPLGAVVVFAVGAAIYSSGRKFVVDKNLRLSRQGRRPEPIEHDEHH